MDVRQRNEHFEFVLNQLKSSLFHVSSKYWDQITIAYEPIWAIGSGLTATVQQAEEMHLYIRQSVYQAFGEEVSDSLSILYGGSCNEMNANNLFACKNVDGGLIGGASLNSESFKKIFKALYELH